MRKTSGEVLREEIIDGLIFIHEYGVTPYSYHTDQQGNRHQHYLATAFITFVLGAFLEVATLRCGYPHFPRFEDFNGTARHVVAGMSYLAIIATVGVIAGILHFGINRLTGVKNRSNYLVQVADDEIELPAMNEKTGLLGKDDKDASIYRFRGCHPIHAVYPATPIKTMIWMSVLMLSVSAIVGLVKPDLVKEFIGNGTAPDCPISHPTDCDSTMNFFIKCGALIGVAFPVILSGMAALSHYAGSKAVAYYQDHQDDKPVTADAGDEALMSNFTF